MKRLTGFFVSGARLWLILEVFGASVAVLALRAVPSEHLVRLLDEALCLADALAQLGLAGLYFGGVAVASFRAIFGGWHMRRTPINLD